MEKKRLFCGCFIDTEMLNVLYPKLKHSFGSCLSGKWVESENLHFTIKFLGDVELKTIPILQSSLKDYLNWNESALQISKIGAFPNLSRCHVLHIEVLNRDGMLLKLFKNIEIVAEDFGFQKEERKFSPHITICRVKSIEPTDFKKVFDEYRNIWVGEMPRFKIDLIESQLTSSGPIYKRL
jgi:RNA 2',3'-cyclic 3'-phosphodiesterase